MAGVMKFGWFAPINSVCRFAGVVQRQCFLIVALAFALIPCVTVAVPVTIDFESLTDSQAVTNQFANLVFSNAAAISAGISLNEFEFPPRSGTNVVFDDAGPISIVFSTAADSFGAYFTYTSGITLKAFGGAANLLGSVSSGFASNTAQSGDLGSSPNEFLNIVFSGIKRIVIEGDPTGGSFAMDDLIYQQSTGTGGTTPEPSTTFLFLATFIAAIVTQNRFRRRAKITTTRLASIGGLIQ